MHARRHTLKLLSLWVLAPTYPLYAEETLDSVHLQHLSVNEVLRVAGNLIDAGRYEEAQVLLDRLARDGVGGAERDFLDGMAALARKDFARAERRFRKILEGDPKLVRVRLELARTLFLMKQDEQADYNFRLAIAEHPPTAVIHNIARFREAIRARRAWRFNINFGIAPDSNINSATNKEHVDIFGLPFSLDKSARAHSGVGMIAGGDASVRVWRNGNMPLYVGGYGRIVNYSGSEFDDVYIGGEAGPEIRIAGGRLRTTATAFQRWYGGKTLSTSFGGKLDFDNVVEGKLGIETALAARRDDYARRDDIDAWNLEATAQANRAINASTLGFVYAVVQRNIAHDPGYSYWSARLGWGLLKEIRWGLRPQISFEIGRQLNDFQLPLFNRARRDWSVQLAASIYKRDWNVAGFAPSIKLSYNRNFSTIPLYDQRRTRLEFGVTKAF